MSRLRELYDRAHPHVSGAEPPSVAELMDWAATELERAQGWRNGLVFTEDGVNVEEQP